MDNAVDDAMIARECARNYFAAASAMTAVKLVKEMKRNVSDENGESRCSRIRRQFSLADIRLANNINSTTNFTTRFEYL